MAIMFGGGWETGDPVAQALRRQLAAGQRGEPLVRDLNQQFGLQSGRSLAYYPQAEQYAMPRWYAAPNAGGALDLIQRPAVTPRLPLSDAASSDDLLDAVQGPLNQYILAALAGGRGEKEV